MECKETFFYISSPSFWKIRTFVKFILFAMSALTLTWNYPARIHRRVNQTAENINLIL